jgi:ABC-type lipoprotein export system ATPase subunit
MVTHEQDIAAYAQRNVIMRDGLILDDHAVSERANAAQLSREKDRLNGSAE